MQIYQSLHHLQEKPTILSNNYFIYFFKLFNYQFFNKQDGLINLVFCLFVSQVANLVGTQVQINNLTLYLYGFQTYRIRSCMLQIQRRNYGQINRLLLTIYFQYLPINCYLFIRYLVMQLFIYWKQMLRFLKEIFNCQYLNCLFFLKLFFIDQQSEKKKQSRLLSFSNQSKMHFQLLQSEIWI
ncbi:hypothetical protein ABPG72_016255 [Tetrahymena utriculariae]